MTDQRSLRMNIKQETLTQVAFLQDALEYLGNEQAELTRLRRETYIYSYGSIIAPVGLTLLTGGLIGAMTDMLIFLGAPSLLSLLPENLQKVLTVAITAYNMYKHSASTVGTVSLGWMITKIINQMSWQESNKAVRDEVNALLLLLIDVSLPRVKTMQKADRVVERGINKQLGFYKPNIPPERKANSAPKKVESVGSETAKKDVDLKQPNDHTSQAQAERVTPPVVDSKMDDVNISKQSAGHNNGAALSLKRKGIENSSFIQYSKSANQNTQPMAPSNRWISLSAIDREWAIHRKALKVSNAVYSDKIPKNCNLCKDLSFNEVLSGLKVNGYQDTQSGVVFLAFMGTNLLDPRDIASDLLLTITGKPPAATHSLVHAIETWQKNHPGTQIVLTGHSLGASVASYVSAKTQLPAIVFENPGLRGSQYALDNVISYQSRRNGINQVNQYINDNGGSHAQYGHKIRLPFPSDIERMISGIPLLGGIFSHLMTYLSDAFDKHMASRRARGLGPCGHETYQYHLTETLVQTAARP